MTTGVQQVRSIRAAQAHVRQRMAEVERQLARLQSDGMPRSQPWMTFRRVSSAAELGGPHISIYDALRADLEQLKRDLRAGEADLRQAQKQAARESAAAASEDFDRKLDKVLKDGEDAGELDTDALDALRGEQEAAMERWIIVLKIDPSEKNIRGGLGQLGRTWRLGFDDQSPKAQGLLTALREAAETLKDIAEADFRRNPTFANFRRYLKGAGQSFMFGGTGLSVLPSGRRRLPHERTYQVAPGDTLSSISLRFYGSESYWDAIFFENRESIGDNPDRLSVGILLRIP